jgi:hypothetical protein
MVEVERELEQLFGPIRAVSTHVEFDHSSYYCREMGSGLIKYHIVFASLISPLDIVTLKYSTSLLEKKYANTDGKRTVNIDPGYFTHAQLVLATHKNYSHRICIGSGVYAELTYQIQGDEWHDLPWTYPDYRLPETKDFFLRERALFLKETKSLRPPPGSRIPLWQLVDEGDEDN